LCLDNMRVRLTLLAAVKSLAKDTEAAAQAGVPTLGRREALRMHRGLEGP